MNSIFRFRAKEFCFAFRPNYLAHRQALPESHCRWNFRLLHRLVGHPGGAVKEKSGCNLADTPTIFISIKGCSRTIRRTSVPTCRPICSVRTGVVTGPTVVAVIHPIVLRRPIPPFAIVIGETPAVGINRRARLIQWSLVGLEVLLWSPRNRTRLLLRLIISLRRCPWACNAPGGISIGLTDPGTQRIGRCCRRTV